MHQIYVIQHIDERTKQYLNFIYP